MYDQFCYIKQKWTESRNPDENENNKNEIGLLCKCICMCSHQFYYYYTYSLLSIFFLFFCCSSSIYEHILVLDGARPITQLFNYVYFDRRANVRSPHAHIDLLPLMQMRWPLLNATCNNSISRWRFPICKFIYSCQSDRIYQFRSKIRFGMRDINYVCFSDSIYSCFLLFFFFLGSWRHLFCIRYNTVDWKKGERVRDR